MTPPRPVQVRDNLIATCGPVSYEVEVVRKAVGGRYLVRLNKTHINIKHI